MTQGMHPTAAPARLSAISQAAALLVAARQTGPIDALPDDLRPRTEADAYAIQREIVANLGTIGGFKVGAAGPDAPPSCAPLLAASLVRHPAATVPAADFTQREIESEIAFCLGTDLPPRDALYTRDDILTAIASCHAGIEILQSRFRDPASIDAISMLADSIQNGAYILGPPLPGWHQIDFSHVTVRQTVGDSYKLATGNPAGDMIRLVMFLANDGAVPWGGLRAGQIVTCGSWTGKTAAGIGEPISTAFDGFPVVTLRFV